MQLGVVFPQTEITEDPGAVRTYAQAAEALGYRHLLAYDHVIGADTSSRPDWRGTYTVESLFHEPFVLFGYLAGLTRLELVTGVIIAPQRQTVLLAKQAAEVDVLTHGRFRLGLGLGWNHVEYEALNQNFRNRGSRLVEQIHVLRALFTESSVTFHGRWHTIEQAGIKPLPVQRPIPIWLGGGVEETFRRVGSLADGWQCNWPPDERASEAIATIHTFAREAGRDPSSIGVEGRLNVARRSEDDWHETARSWRDLGATHLSVNTMNAGLEAPDAHIRTIERVWSVLGGLASPAADN